MSYESNDGGESYAADYGARVRATAIWAAIGGGLMLYFGSMTFTSLLDSPAYAASLTARTWTLRIGGGTMVAVAGLCLTGWPWALLLDAIICAGVAVMLGVTGVVFLANGDNEGILSLVFAAVFAGAGWKSWQDFRFRPRVGGLGAAPSPGAFDEPAPLPREVDVKGHAVLEAIRRRRAGEAPPAAPVTQAEDAVWPRAAGSKPVEAGNDAPTVAGEESRPHPAGSPEVSAPAADGESGGGFLAALAREDESRKRRP